MKLAFSFLFGSFLFASSSFAQAPKMDGAKDIPKASADDIVGVWWAPKKDARLEVYKEKDLYFGKLVWVTPEKAEDLDKNNPDEALKKQKILGLVILKNFKFDDGKWVDGQIYDPKNGKTYSCKMSIDGTKLNVRGYIGFSLLGRTEEFEKYVGN